MLFKFLRLEMMKLTYNPGHNILGLHNALVQVLVATGKAELDIEYSKQVV